MPESSKKHDNAKIEEVAPLCHSVSTQRDIQGIPQETRKSNMPTSPELDDGSSLVWREEVQGKKQPEHPCKARGHVAVAARAPVAGVMVILEPKFDDAVPLETLSDAEGGFGFEEVLTGKWLVRISLEGDREEQRVIFVAEGAEVALGTIYAAQGGVTRYRTVARDKGKQRAADK